MGMSAVASPAIDWHHRDNSIQCPPETWQQIRDFAKQFLLCVIPAAQYGITVILMRLHFDERKSGRLRANPKRGVGFEEAQEVFSRPYYLDHRSDLPKQYRAIGWVGEQLYTVIFEVREDEEGEYYHLVTLWKATKQEQQLYGEHS
jgi:uncharacterized DUF497 family protein